MDYKFTSYQKFYISFNSLYYSFYKTNNFDLKRLKLYVIKKIKMYKIYHNVAMIHVLFNIYKLFSILNNVI